MLYKIGWHLKEVVVESQANSRKWLFECNRWLNKFEDDGKIERELVAIEQPKTKKTLNQMDPHCKCY